MSLASTWSARSAGEKRLLLAAAAIAIVLLAIAFVWLPLERTRTRLATQLPELRASVEQMRAQSAEAKRLRALPARAPASGAQPPALALAGSLAQALPGARLATLDPKRVKVAMDDASWTRVLEWLASAQAAQGLAVESAQVEALATRGRVRAEFVLAAP